MFPGTLSAMKSEDGRGAAREFVRAEMLRRGISRKALTEKADVDAKTLRAFLTGDRWPQEETRIAIATALGWPADEIDQIEKTGVHRGLVEYVDAVSGERRPKPVLVTTDSMALSRHFSEVLQFAVAVQELDPTLEPEVDNFLDVATELYSRTRPAIATQNRRRADEFARRRGGDGDDGSAAPMNDEQIAALDDEQNAPGQSDEG